MSNPLATTVAAMIDSGRGLLAADESTATITKRFASIDLESTEVNRRDYREMLFSTAGLGQFISGVILYDETIRQSAASGEKLTEMLLNQGIVPGIKVDKGLVDLAKNSPEKFTQGLDGLGERMAEYWQLGARFAKWRAVYSITDDLPSSQAITINAQGLAQYARICQQHNIVPIVEPEVLMDGDHTIERCAEVTEAVLYEVFKQLRRHGVELEHMILKPNMVISGGACSVTAGPQRVAELTVEVFSRAVPAAVPGIMFLSGGQSDEAATANLDAINKLSAHHPWVFSFSYGRALQAPALTAWGGLAATRNAGQKALLKRSKLNSAACAGKYSSTMEAG